MLGTLCLANRQELKFSPEVVEMVTAMGNQLGIAVANARLYQTQLRENEKLHRAGRHQQWHGPAA